MPDPDRELQWLRRLRDLSHRLAAEHDVRRLPPLILDAAVELTRAERGFLVRVQSTGAERGGGKPRIQVEVARGFDRETLQGAQGKVSRTVVERVIGRERGLVTTSEEDADVREVSSVQARRVLSILCVPLRLRGAVHGVLYLDHRFDPQVFTEADLPVVEAFADQAALALETAALHARPGDEGRPAQGATIRGDAPVGAVGAVAAVTAVGGAASQAPRGRFGRLIGASPVMGALYAEIERAAQSDAPVLILGESGSGKELVARELHDRGQHAAAPFLSESCAAFADSLLESELFGHRQGAFTGATADHPGLFARAGEGTLFLDEVGEMSPTLQAKLLRVLQEREVRPVGADRPEPVRCRLIAATHRDLRERVADGSFREDLYYRLDVLRIQVPALRQRPDDVPALFAHALAREGRPDLELSEKAAALLTGYRWPGNVRELENEARRLAALAVERITARQLSDEVREGRGLARPTGGYGGKTLGEVEREMVALAMEEAGGNKARAARALGIPKTTLYHLLDRYGLR